MRGENGLKITEVEAIILRQPGDGCLHSRR